MLIFCCCCFAIFVWQLFVGCISVFLHIFIFSLSIHAHVWYFKNDVSVFLTFILALLNLYVLYKWTKNLTERKREGVFIQPLSYLYTLRVFNFFNHDLFFQDLAKSGKKNKNKKQLIRLNKLHNIFKIQIRIK